MKTLIYKREYDNPRLPNGELKHNELLGEFDIIETLTEGVYDNQYIGTKDEKIFLITESEVAGPNGGSKFEVIELKSVIIKQ